VAWSATGPSAAPAKDISNAVALQLAGIGEYLGGPDKLDTLTSAAQDLEQARRLIPYNGDAISLAVGSQLSQEWKKDRKCEQPALKAQRLTAAGALGSDSPAALANLTNLYRMLLQTPTESGPNGLPKAQVQERLNTVQSLKSPN